jgi:hypothetical protein
MRDIDRASPSRAFAHPSTHRGANFVPRAPRVRAIRRRTRTVHDRPARASVACASFARDYAATRG